MTGVRMIDDKLLYRLIQGRHDKKDNLNIFLNLNYRQLKKIYLLIRERKNVRNGMNR